MKWWELRTPAACVDRTRVAANARRMREKAAAAGVRLRPHVKTHKTVRLALEQTGGAPGPVTASTLAEVRGLLRAGFRDQTLAFPLAPARAGEACALAAEMDAFGVLLDQPEQVEALAAAARHGRARPRVWVEVDCGYGRGGWLPAAEDLARVVAAVDEEPELAFAGLLTHGGQAYSIPGQQARAAVARREAEALHEAARSLAARGLPAGELSLGSTPSMSAAEPRDLLGIDEMRPGNYVFFDRHQVALGSCADEEVAFSVATTVVGRYPARGEIVLDAGALALSKDAGAGEGFGVLATGTGSAERLLPGASIVRLSQEHAVCRVADVRAFAIGDRLRVVPNHSCLAAAGHEVLHLLEGDEVVERLEVLRGW